MNLFEQVYKQLLSEGQVSINKINLAIDRHRLVLIRYNTHGEHVAMADRLCGVFAYGVTKAGNECIRVFEYKGDTTTFVPGWKLIRLDRIIAWRTTKRTFSSPPTNTGVGEFNPNGDNSMSIVYKVAKFDNIPVSLPQGNEPKTANTVKTSYNPQTQTQRTDVNKAEIGLKPYQNNPTIMSNAPKTAQDVKGMENAPLMKTDTEKAIDYLRQQLDNPVKIDLSKFAPKQQQNKKASQPTKVQGQVQQDKNNQQNSSETPLMKTDTEKAIDYLRKQLENPEKIDLSRIPKK